MQAVPIGCPQSSPDILPELHLVIHVAGNNECIYHVIAFRNVIGIGDRCSLDLF